MSLFSHMDNANYDLPDYLHQTNAPGSPVILGEEDYSGPDHFGGDFSCSKGVRPITSHSCSSFLYSGRDLILFLKVRVV